MRASKREIGRERRSERERERERERGRGKRVRPRTCSDRECVGTGEWCACDRACVRVCVNGCLVSGMLKFDQVQKVPSLFALCYFAAPCT